MPRARSAAQDPIPLPPRRPTMPAPITRHTVDVSGRRVHYRRRGQGPAVVLLHESPRSSAALLPLVGYGPDDVTVFAFDTPGCGDSDPLAQERPQAADYGDALDATLQALGIARCVVYGTHTGAAIAMALARRHPARVSRLVIDGLGVFDAVERAQILDSYLPPFVPQLDGTHLAWLWGRVRDQFLFFPWNHRGMGARLWRALPEPALQQQVAMDLLRAGDAYRAPYAAAFRYQPGAALAELRVPTFVGARSDDMLLPHLTRLGALAEGVQVAPLPADRPAWGARLWAEIRAGLAGLPDAPAAPPESLPAHDGARTRLGNVFTSAAAQQLHVRGALGAPQAAARPLVLLHDSPGGARGLDREALRAAVQGRTVVAPELPCHGDSPALPGMDSADAVAVVVHAALVDLGLGEADVRGMGSGAHVAAALARAHSQRYAVADARPVLRPARVPAGFAPRADGGHLFAAWFHARDEAILGPWWARTPDGRHDCGDDIDLPTVHARTVDALREAPEAVALRAALWAAEG